LNGSSSISTKKVPLITCIVSLELLMSTISPNQAK
jgi:hypothetical protein